MRVAVFLAVCLTSLPMAWAQLTPDEAYQRLKEREKERATATATQPANAQSPQTAAPVHGAPMAEAQLLHKGWAALAAKHYEDALATFEKATAIDSADPNALMGSGICKYELNDQKKAAKDLAKAYELASKGGADKVSRQLVIASAAAEVANDNPMRAAKLLRGVMEGMERNSRLDEELQNDLGIALSHANSQARTSPLFDESLKYYLAYDKKLDQQRNDGTARWGIQWLSKADAEEKWKDYKDASSQVQQAGSTLDHVMLAKATAYDHYIELHGMRLHSTAEINKYMSEYKQAIKDENIARGLLAKAERKFSAVDKPPFPDRIEHDWAEPR